MKQILTGALIAILTVLSGSAALADDFFVARESSGSEPPREIQYWYGEDKAARVTEGFTIITRLDLGKAYMVNHADKTYSVSDLSTGSDPGLDDEVTLEVTDETRTISSWNCRKQIIRIPMGGAEMEVTIWASTDVSYDAALYKRLMVAMADQMGMAGLKAMADIEGFPVLQEVSFGTITTRQELVSVESKPAPAGTYEPPAGYTAQ